MFLDLSKCQNWWATQLHVILEYGIGSDFWLLSQAFENNEKLSLYLMTMRDELSSSCGILIRCWGWVQVLGILIEFVEIIKLHLWGKKKSNSVWTVKMINRNRKRVHVFGWVLSKSKDMLWRRQTQSSRYMTAKTG